MGQSGQYGGRSGSMNTSLATLSNSTTSRTDASGRQRSVGGLLTTHNPAYQTGQLVGKGFAVVHTLLPAGEHVVSHQEDRQLLGSGRERDDLLEDLLAPPVVLNHPDHARRLALDPPSARDQLALLHRYVTVSLAHEAPPKHLPRSRAPVLPPSMLHRAT